MSNQKISDLTAGHRAYRGDLYESTQASNSRSILAEQLIYPASNLPPAIPSAFDDEFDASTLNGIWSWMNQGSATVTFAGSTACFKVDTTGSRKIRAIVQNLPVGNWQIDCKLATNPSSPGVNNTTSGVGWGSAHAAGLCLTDGTKLICQYLTFDTVYRVYNQFMNSVTSFNATTCYFDYVKLQQWYWLRIVNDGTHYNYFMSFDGINYLQYGQETLTAHLTATQMGICMDALSGAAFALVVDYFRVS